jgi:peptide deformylase
MIFGSDKSIEGIVQRDEPVLREIATEVSLDEIGTPALTAIINQMQKVLVAQVDGVALAAPQIGISKRIVVISGKVFLDPDDMDSYKDTSQDIICINPRLIKSSKERENMPEGCLSVRWLYGKVRRSKKATLEAYDRMGKKFTLSGKGLLAQIFQHEIDHLNGSLFIDVATELETIDPVEEKKKHRDRRTLNKKIND